LGWPRFASNAQIGEEALPELLKVYETDKDAKRRRAAVMSIGYMGPIAKSSLPKLEAEKKRIDELEEKSKDDEWLELALKKAITRISDPNAMPVEKMFRE
jgi:HEAT repeat protein